MPQQIINNLGQIVGSGEITGNKLVITLDLHEPTPSKGGKLFEVASTGGFKTPGLVFKGKPIALNVYAGVKIAA
jgi:hypothetical protein